MVSRKTNLSSAGSEKPSARRAEKPARKKRTKRPLDETSLRDLALSYAARFASTGARLEAYLARKIRERGVAEDQDGRVRELDVTGLVTRLIELGYVDDDAYARMKSRDLAQRGYGARRVEQALWAAGVEEHVREDNALSEAQQRRAAGLMAKKRRFGAYARALSQSDEGDNGNSAERQKQRDKQIAAMLRAGHDFEMVRFILDAASQEDIEDWVIEAEEDEADHGDF